MSHAKKVMQSYERMFRIRGKQHANQLLYIMGLFDRPAEGAAIDAMRTTPGIPDLTDLLSELDSDEWIALKTELRENGLLLAENRWDRGNLDAHPLVREYFGDALRRRNKSAWVEGHRRLCTHLAATTENQPDDPSAMSRLYSAVNHACSAGDYLMAFEELIRRRAWRLDNPDEKQWWYATRRLGLVGDDLVALSQLYTKKWNRLHPVLGVENEIQILSDTGVRMRSLGRLDDSEAFACFSEAYKRSLKILESGAQSVRGVDRIFDGAYASCQLSELRLVQGKLGEAMRAAKEALRLADICRNQGHRRHPYIRMHARSSLADVHFQLGDIQKAEELFEEARMIDANEGSRPPFMHSQSCYRYGMLLIETGRHAQLLNYRTGQRMGN